VVRPNAGIARNAPPEESIVCRTPPVATPVRVILIVVVIVPVRVVPWVFVLIVVVIVPVRVVPL
jgi:hypothetical protein